MNICDNLGDHLVGNVYAKVSIFSPSCCLSPTAFLLKFHYKERSSASQLVDINLHNVRYRNNYCGNAMETPGIQNIVVVIPLLVQPIARVQYRWCLTLRWPMSLCWQLFFSREAWLQLTGKVFLSCFGPICKHQGEILSLPNLWCCGIHNRLPHQLILTSSFSM